MLPAHQPPGSLSQPPDPGGPIAVIDVGGNVSLKGPPPPAICQAGCHLSVLYERNIECKSGIIKIGVESKKGTSELRQAYQLLQESQNEAFQFIGNIEARDVFKGEADVSGYRWVYGKCLTQIY